MNEKYLYLYTGLTQSKFIRFFYASICVFTLSYFLDFYSFLFLVLVFVGEIIFRGEKNIHDIVVVLCFF